VPLRPKVCEGASISDSQWRISMNFVRRVAEPLSA
jgi:cytochrome c-type biogenesis protein CcmH/NrfF